MQAGGTRVMNCSRSPKSSPNSATSRDARSIAGASSVTHPAGIKLPNGEIRIWRSDFLAWLERLREAA